MNKQIQIDLELFLWIYDYIAEKSDTESIMIRQEMDKKIDKILAHELYSKKIKKRYNNDR